MSEALVIVALSVMFIMGAVGAGALIVLCIAVFFDRTWMDDGPACMASFSVFVLAVVLLYLRH